MDIIVPCWQCSYADDICRVPLEKFNDHNLEYHDGCTHKCETCPNVFSTSEDLDLHLKDHAYFVCTGCFERHGMERILEWDNFSRHYNEFHKLWDIRCQWCPNRFHHLQKYEEHREKFHVHVPRTVPVKVRCRNCNDGYAAEKDVLQVHNAAVHNPKHFPFECPTCGNVFEISADCDIHSRTCLTRTQQMEGSCYGLKKST